MRKRMAVVFVTTVLSLGLLPVAAHAGQYCERADEVGAGGACRAAGGAVVETCAKVKVDCRLG
jgi:hypothetical protein